MTSTKMQADFNIKNISIQEVLTAGELDVAHSPGM
jgi:hypothetical protein